ncbi:MAG TPA: ABC transporter substrate-binding protein [Burkholderiales bacterium]|nr:ABC transporter substrate-binding protein [Burkholderiales bacterium]
MNLSRRSAVCGLLWAVGLLLAPSVRSAMLEKPSLTIAVGGKSSLYYLPLTLAERLGYFQKEGLSVEIADFAGGSKALQAMIGGSADVTAGGYDHTIVMLAKGQKVQGFVLMVATPAISVGVAKARMPGFHSLKDLKGMKIGVSAPGSSTHMVVNRLLASAGLGPDDVSIVGVGTGPAAVAAMRSGQIDAIAGVEPAISMLESAGAVTVVAETMTEKGTRAIFGTPQLPAGCLYTKEEFIRRNPRTVQALTSAMVRTLQWLAKASDEEIAQTVPPEYLMGDRRLYLAALRKSRDTYSKDGLIPAAGAQALYEALRGFDATVKDAPGLMIGQTYDMAFVRKALAESR